ncbi:Serine/threonine-protein kinase csk1 [Fusarium oxysporum f. sp. raphani]|uniref:cyclin-dependent kinase n=1 Tax=Fusarium oxysporum f. sp. raphani TaxID=96318 RepID=A0A8J5QEM1_FUSOX|nr:Serine/threonine-protein kinase csk1 [Fusarium oxysporum f. sp. raphani]
MELPEWKAALTMSQRYETIQKIQASLATTSMSEAIAIEQAAYQIASTQDEYNLACQPTSTPTPPPLQEEEEGDSGIRIGPYGNCRPVSDGVTSEVFRSGDKALKVIVTYQDIEPHNPQREAKILKGLREPCIPLLETFRDQEQRFVLVFPFMPYTLADLLANGPLPLNAVRSIFRDVLHALKDIHAQGIIHRDIKPSAILLSSPTGPAYLSDFGTAWHPELSTQSEPADDKILDIGTGPYRAIEVLFGHKSYGPEVDMWGIGVMLSEALRDPPTPIFESRAVHEDGNQLGLILSVFKTIGTPTPETWPEAKQFKVAPFELWTVFPARPWEDLLPNADPDFIDLVSSLLRYDSQRLTAEQALAHKALAFIPSEVDKFKNPPRRDNTGNDNAGSSEKNGNSDKKDDKQSGFVENKEDGGARLVEESEDNEEGGAKL